MLICNANFVILKISEACIGFVMKHPFLVLTKILTCPLLFFSLVEKVWSCAKQRVIIIEQQNIGSMPRIILPFSTCVTVQSFHGFGG
ncbi:hypothetical protein RIF29_14281 [Crotalaria pallida]|uniref:Uncharacterized protein n=1 Tax=Crotalaria pallida TaxID=3830 RepID=A0AAN9IBG4_CROPI